ncbi:hypothetical protein B0H14DRAFT_2609092 [Mycena olivaceomarginata]|nr:hypothetical protein B0H14DRAFT_2609092 [Mycena olivaceomarginata]
MADAKLLKKIKIPSAGTGTAERPKRRMRHAHLPMQEDPFGFDLSVLDIHHSISNVWKSSLDIFKHLNAQTGDPAKIEDGEDGLGSAQSPGADNSDKEEDDEQDSDSEEGEEEDAAPLAVGEEDEVLVPSDDEEMGMDSLRQWEISPLGLRALKEILFLGLQLQGLAVADQGNISRFLIPDSDSGSVSESNSMFPCTILSKSSSPFLTHLAPTSSSKKVVQRLKVVSDGFLEVLSVYDALRILFVADSEMQIYVAGNLHALRSFRHNCDLLSRPLQPLRFDGSVDWAIQTEELGDFQARFCR